MPIDNCPLICSNGSKLAILPIKIINPHTKKSCRAKGLIDTGAGECAIPATVASILGHNLQAGKTKTIMTGNGPTTASAHSTEFEIYHPTTGDFLYKIENTPIDFMPNLNVFLLGVNSFLSDFVLTIDYPGKVFSIKHP